MKKISHPIGLLALQGDFQTHAEHLQRFFGIPTKEVRRAEELQADFSAFILPGGESSAMLKLMSDEFRKGLQEFCSSGKVPIFATCAGCILLAQKVLNPEQFSFGALDITVERNSFGRQKESFHTNTILLEEHARSLFVNAHEDLSGIFIRAPRILSVGPEEEILARFNGEPVLVRGGRKKNVWCTTFHPELESSPSPILHSFLKSSNLL